MLSKRSSMEVTRCSIASARLGTAEHDHFGLEAIKALVDGAEAGEHLVSQLSFLSIEELLKLWRHHLAVEPHQRLEEILGHA